MALGASPSQLAFGVTAFPRTHHQISIPVGPRAGYHYTLGGGHHPVRHLSLSALGQLLEGCAFRSLTCPATLNH